MFSRVLIFSVAIGITGNAYGIFDTPIPPAPTPLLTPIPDCKPDPATLLTSLRRCRLELEVYRTSELEGFNERLQTYSAQLKDFDAALERAHAKGEIGKNRYSAVHKQVEQAIFAASPSGKLGRLYKGNLEKYRQISQWVIGEIRQIERKSLGSRYKEAR